MWKFPLFLIGMLALFHNLSHANSVSCPNSNLVKSVSFIDAAKRTGDVWEFVSTVFTHDGREWNIYFGSFFEEAHNKSEALQQGQRYFQDAKVIIKDAQPIPVPNNVLICDYVPTGRDYWFAAVSPPEFNLFKTLK